jgi:hypothetical protein
MEPNSTCLITVAKLGLDLSLLVESNKSRSGGAAKGCAAVVASGRITLFTDVFTVAEDLSHRLSPTDNAKNPVLHLQAVY